MAPGHYPRQHRLELEQPAEMTDGNRKLFGASPGNLPGDAFSMPEARNYIAEKPAWQSRPAFPVQKLQLVIA